MSSFETMRHHQRKIYLPLAIVVTVTFIFFGAWNASQSGPDRDGGWSASLGDELALVGQDLQKAGLIQPPPRKVYEEQAERADPLFPKEADETPEQFETRKRDYERRIRQEANVRSREYYRLAGLRAHHLPMKEGERLGVRVSDEEIGRRIREFVMNYWGHKEFDDQAYREELSARDLSVHRFEKLIVGQAIRERLGGMLTASAGAFESEQYYVYARERQKVRVQYFQRSPGEFLAKVQVKPGERPSEKPAEKPVEKPAEPAAGGEQAGKADEAGAAPAAPEAGSQDPQKTPEAAPPKDELGVIYEGGIARKFEERCTQIKDSQGFKDDKEFEWPGWVADAYPDIFAEARAGVEGLLALTADFEAGIKIPQKDIGQHYNDNKHLYEEKPPEKTEKAPKDAPKAEPKYKPLAEVRKEIEKKLVKDRAADAAVKALDAALKEYNALAADQRPKLAELAARHKPLRAEPAVAGTLKELEEKKYLDSRGIDLAAAFDRTRRTELAGKLADRRALDDDLGFLALRVTEFHPVAMRTFDEAKEGFTHRLKYVEAWKLAKQAIDDDRKALEEGKLDPARVRLSRLLGHGDETSEVVGESGQAVGEASTVYRYKQPLGPEDDEDRRLEEAEREKAAEGGKKPPPGRKTVQERVVESLDTDRRSAGRYRGYRVVVLAERHLPGFEEFARDRGWRRQWRPERMSEQYLQMLRRFGGQTPGDVEWREDFLQEYYRSLYEQFTARG